MTDVASMVIEEWHRSSSRDCPLAVCTPRQIGVAQHTVLPVCCAALHTVHDFWLLVTNHPHSTSHLISLYVDSPVFLSSVKKTLRIASNIFPYVMTALLNLIPLTRRSAKSRYGSRLIIWGNIKENLKINKIQDRI